MISNKELAVKVLDKIKLDPREWDQEDYIRPDEYCGSAKCFAGWACILAGGYKEVIVSENGDYYAYIADTSTGYSIDIHDTAEKLLGLTENQSGELFDGGNTLADLERLVAEYYGGDEVPPPVYVITTGEPFPVGTPIEDRYRMGEDE